MTDEANNITWRTEGYKLRRSFTGKKAFHSAMVPMRLKQSNYMKELSNVISYLMTISLCNCPQLINYTLL